MSYDKRLRPGLSEEELAQVRAGLNRLAENAEGRVRPRA
jgi:hypothetical protein